MTTAPEWDAAQDELARRGAQSSASQAYCAAVSRAGERLRDDPRVAVVHLQVSHATLIIKVCERERSVGLGWDDRQGKYDVFFVGPRFEFTELCTVDQDIVVETVVGYLDRVRG